VVGGEQPSSETKRGAKGSRSHWQKRMGIALTKSDRRAKEKEQVVMETGAQEQQLWWRSESVEAFSWHFFL
jgi:hypothetical protein